MRDSVCYVSIGRLQLYDRRIAAIVLCGLLVCRLDSTSLPSLQLVRGFLDHARECPAATLAARHHESVGTYHSILFRTQ
jgi:hypothetical protein